MQTLLGAKTSKVPKGLPEVQEKGLEMQDVIKLTRGLFSIVDEALFDELSKFKWHATKNGYAATNKMKGGVRTCIYMHRLVANAKSGIEVDHINGNTLDNRASNLRLCSHSQNGKNLKLSKANKTGFKGVDKHSQNGNYRAQIMSDGKLIHLGCYQTAFEAGVAYMKASELLHKEFIRKQNV